MNKFKSNRVYNTPGHITRNKCKSNNVNNTLCVPHNKEYM